MPTGTLRELNKSKLQLSQFSLCDSCNTITRLNLLSTEVAIGLQKIWQLKSQTRFRIDLFH